MTKLLNNVRQPNELCWFVLEEKDYHHSSINMYDLPSWIFHSFGSNTILN